MDRITRTGLRDLGARSWLSFQIFDRGANLAAFFGFLGLEKLEEDTLEMAARLLEWSVRRDRRRWKSR